MKFSNSYQEHSLTLSGRPKKSLDVLVSERGSFRTMVSLRPPRIMPKRTKSVSGKRILDGAQREKQALLAELREWSVRDVLWRFVRRTEIYARRIKRLVFRLIPHFAPHKMLYGSLTAGVVFGMVSMAFMTHYFGSGVFAGFQDADQSAAVSEGNRAAVAGEMTVSEQEYDGGSDIFFEYFNEAADEEYKKNVRNMVKGYPIEEMLPHIFEQDRLTAAFLVGIAKKESNWGKRVPVLDGQDCFNYWGYRGIRRMMGTGGHTCFNSRKDAVETVAKRLNTLIHSEKLNTPEKMIVWKCGFSCSGHSRESVRKWISDVDMYFEELNQEE